MIQSSRFIHLVRNGGDSLLRILPTSLYNMIISQAAKVENQIKSQASEKMVREAQNALPQIPSSDVMPGSVHGSQGMPQFPPSLPEITPTPQTMVSPPDPSKMATLQSPQQQASAPFSPQQVPTDLASQGTAPKNPIPRGLGEPATPQDSQSTADNLGRLQPLSPQKNARDMGYRSEHRGDMQRLIEENLIKHSEEEQND
jgi:hypothetical protein